MTCFMWLLPQQGSIADLLAIDACVQLAAGHDSFGSACCCCKPPKQQCLGCPMQILQIHWMQRQTQCPQRGPCVAPVAGNGIM